MSSRISQHKKSGKTTEEMRVNRINNQVQLRKINREETLNKARNISSNEHIVIDNDLIQFNDLDSLLGYLQNSDPEMRFIAVQFVSKKLSDSDALIDQILQFGIAPILIDCLTDERYPNIQLEAITSLTYLTTGTVEQTCQVVHCGVISPTLGLIESKNLQVRQQATLILGNIIGDSAEFRDYIMGTNALLLILNLIVSDNSVVNLKIVSWIISNICRHVNHPLNSMTVLKLLPILRYFLQHTDNEVLCDSLNSIKYLLESDKYNIETIINHDIARLLISLLTHKNIKIQLSALSAVGTIATGSIDECQHLLDLKFLDSLFALLHHPNRLIRTKSLWILSNIAVGNEKQIQAVLNFGFLPLVIQQLQVDDVRSQEEATWVVCNLIVYGSSEQKQYLIMNNIISPFCKLLSTNNVVIIQVVLKALIKLLDDTFDENDTICNQIEECDGLDSIVDLQLHDNEEIYQLAFYIIHCYFSAEQELFH